VVVEMTSNTPRGAPPLPTTAATYRQFAYNGRGELTAGIVPRHGSQRRDQRHRGSDFLSQQESSCIRPGPSVDDIVHRTDFRRTALLVQDIETPRQCPVSAHQCKCAQAHAGKRRNEGYPASDCWAQEWRQLSEQTAVESLSRI